MKKILIIIELLLISQWINAQTLHATFERNGKKMVIDANKAYTLNSMFGYQINFTDIYGNSYNNFSVMIPSLRTGTFIFPREGIWLKSWIKKNDVKQIINTGIYPNNTVSGNIKVTAIKGKYPIGTFEFTANFKNDHIKIKGYFNADVIKNPVVKTVTKNSSSSFVDTRDNQSYKTVEIGGKIWMAENLNYKTSKGSFCYEDNPENCNTYGRLYEFKIAQKACPLGWHLPTVADTEVLTKNIGKFNYFYNNPTFDKVLEGGSSGFKAKFAGVKNDPNSREVLKYKEIYVSQGKATSFWVNKASSAGRAYVIYLKAKNKLIYFNDDMLCSAVSVRCVKN